jgi:hypothetical protein
MNELKMYSVYDTKSELFSSPHFLQSDGVAVRSFSTACDDPKTQLAMYPEDFSLYCVGTFNIESGNISPIQPKQLCNAAEFVSKPVAPEVVSEFARREIEKLEDSNHIG